VIESGNWEGYVRTGGVIMYDYDTMYLLGIGGQDI
jgi:hypothetical protein